MKSKQYSVKIYECEISDDGKFMDFFDKNYTLFKDHLIVINGTISPTIKEYLEKKSLIYLNNFKLPKKRSKREIEDVLLAKRQEIEIDKMIAEAKIKQLSNRLQNNLKVIDEVIRSGREIRVDGDLLLLNRVNSGATIHTTGNLIITQLVEGAIRCNGNFMMISTSPKANVIFHGVEVDNKYLEGKLNRVELKNNEILITPVLKKEINWV